MPKTYGKTVEELSIQAGKKWVRLSTHCARKYIVHMRMGVKPLEFPTFLPNFYTQISPGYLSFSPLVEYIFYPVSTAPITNFTKEKIKER
jgi:hypothetical protein